jgi:hypothetical protein
MAFIPVPRPQTASSVACAGLADKHLPNTTVTTAEAITSGSFTPPGSTNAITNLPPFCRVAGVVQPTSESHILFEVRERGFVRRRRSAGSIGCGGRSAEFLPVVHGPGMAHCGGGPGPNSFDMQAALEQWVQRGIAPEEVIATHSTNGVVDRLRPLCPYPKVAVYKGKGDTNDATNFVCRNPKATGGS